ncbi:MAG TPA: TadE/TadG family type IV pilus assembly protein [Candidatus Elarobacter sp.]|jgi:Flp pilus assembly protein TadG
MSPLRRLPRGDDGSALAELAIILPLLCLLLTGLMEAGRYGYYTILVANAARAGAQYGAQNLVTAANAGGKMEASALADGQNVSGLSASAAEFCTCADGSASTCLPTDCATSHRNVFVQVTATGTFPSLLNYSALPASLRSITVTDVVTMRVSP